MSTLLRFFPAVLHTSVKVYKPYVPMISLLYTVHIFFNLVRIYHIGLPCSEPTVEDITWSARTSQGQLT